MLFFKIWGVLILMALSIMVGASLVSLVLTWAENSAPPWVQGVVGFLAITGLLAAGMYLFVENV